jgi:hypothetical protein
MNKKVKILFPFKFGQNLFLKAVGYPIYYLFFISLLATTLPAIGQVATYPLDVDLVDTTNNYDATSVGSISFMTDGDRNFARFGEDGVMTLPAPVSNALNSASSLKIEFEIRIDNPDSVSDCCYPISMLSNLDYDMGYWGGFNLLVQHFPGFTPEETYLVLLLTDGASNDFDFSLTSAPDENLGDWRKITIRIELLKNLVVVNDGGNITIKNLPEGFDAASFQQGVLNNPLMISGLQNNDPAISPFLDLDELTVYAPAPAVDNDLNSAFVALTNDLNGSGPLTEQELEVHLDIILENLYLADFDAIKVALFAYTAQYEADFPPLYSDGIQHTFEDLPVHDRLLQYAQGYVFETQYQPSDLEERAGLSFEHAEVIPGSVPVSTPRVASANVQLDGSYHRDIAAQLTDQSQVVRPTGYYLVAGDLVTIDVPASVIDDGLSVVVGHHFRNMDYDYINVINRFPDISAEFPLDSTSIKVANPFGGGIYLKVPEGTDAGSFAMTISNAVQSPYFSWRQGQQTDVSEWLSVVASTGAPWADFESDKFMFTVPTEELTGIINPDEIMTRWDSIMDAISLVGGRPAERPRAEYYTFDTRLVTPAYGAGYPMVMPISETFRDTPQDGWSPLEVLNYKPARILLHEMGHNQIHPTLGYGGNLDQCHFLEAETVVHNLALAVDSEVYGDSLDEAFQNSAFQNLSFDQAAFDWIITSTFRSNERMYEETDAPIEDSNQLHYQHRGHAKYGDIARLFGMMGLSTVNAQFYNAGQEQASEACAWRPYIVGRDDYIQAASDALGFNLAPLLHFWGIKPSEQLIANLSNYPESQDIKDLLIYYRSNVAPKTMQDYLIYHNQFPTDDYQFPRYEQYLMEFDNEFANEIDAQFELLMNLYFKEDMIFKSGFE